MAILGKTQIEKMLAELRTEKDPAEAFIKTRKLVSHFIVAIEKEGSDEIINLLHEALKWLEQNFEKIADQNRIRDIFKAVDVLLQLLKQYNTVTRVASYVVDTVNYIIRLTPPAVHKKLHKSLVELFRDRVSQLYQERTNGLVMMKCLQMLFQYIVKFPSKVREEALADLIKSLSKDDNDQLLAIGKWKKGTVEQCSRSFANSMPGAKFYVLAVSSASCGGRNLKPATGKAIYVEFNTVVLNYSFEALEENDESVRQFVVRFADIQKYKFINDQSGSCVEMLLQDAAAMRFHVIYAEDLLELRQFLSTAIGHREENAATSLDMVITHIRLDESSVFNRERHASVESCVIPEDTRLTLEPSAFDSIELHDTTAPGSSHALEQEPDAPREEGVDNGHVNPVTADNGGTRPDLDPYDISHIRDEDSPAPCTSGGKRGRGSRTAKNAPPSNRKTNKENERPQSLTWSIAEHRAQKAAPNGNERPAGPPGSATGKARSTSVAMQSMSDDDNAEITAPDSDDSWQPGRQKAPLVEPKSRGRGPGRRPLTAMKISTEKVTTIKQQAKGPGRRESVMSYEKITSFPCNNDLAANTDSVDSGSAEIYEMLQQIQKNRILDTNSNTSSASFGSKRKSPSNENAKNQGTSGQPSAANDAVWANKRFAPADTGSMMEVAPSESARGEMDLRPQDASDLSFKQPSEMGMSMDLTSSKLHYVLHHIITPNIEECKEIRERNMANVENYLDPILKTRQELLDAIKQKKECILQLLQAANQGFSELNQLNLEFNRSCPSDSELEQRIRKAEEDDHKLTEKMKNDKVRWEKVIDEAIAHDWQRVGEAYVNQVYAVFNSNR